MSLSSGQLAQMEMAAVNRRKDKEYLLLEEEIMSKWAMGELVEVCHCEHCIYNDADKSKDEHGYHCTRYGMWGSDGSSFYCGDGKRKEKDNGSSN